MKNLHGTDQQSSRETLLLRFYKSVQIPSSTMLSQTNTASTTTSMVSRCRGRSLFLPDFGLTPRSNLTFTSIFYPSICLNYHIRIHYLCFPSNSFVLFIFSSRYYHSTTSYSHYHSCSLVSPIYFFYNSVEYPPDC